MKDSVDREIDHIRALAESFLLARYRERARHRPEELVDDLCHDLPSKLDTRFVIPITGTVKTDAELISVIRVLTESRSAFFLGSWSGYEMGDYPLEQAIGMVNNCTGAAASIEPGALVYYKTEASLVPGRGLYVDSYLLIKDAVRLKAARQRIGSLPKGRTEAR